MEEIEIICLDDGSTDSSVNILNEYKAKDSRVRVLFHEHTGKGAAGARNMGMEYATGEYLLFLDSDDYFELDMAEKAYNKAMETDADIVLFDARIVDSQDGHELGGGVLYPNHIPRKAVFNAKDCPETIFLMTTGVPWSKIWKNSFVKENKLRFQHLHYWDDFFFTFAGLASAERITVLQKKLVMYRVDREGSQSVSKTKDFNCSLVIEEYKELKNFLVEKKLYEVVKVCYWHKIIESCLATLKTLNDYSEFAYLYNAIREWLIEETLLDPTWKEYFIEEDCDVRRRGIARILSCIFLAEEGNEFLRRCFSNKPLKGASFPVDLIRESDKVVLYGAGDVGKSFFFQNLRFKHCKLVAWVDRDYREIGFPVCAPETVMGLEFDKIVIGVEKAELVAQIKGILIGMGVAEDKIKWQYPY